MDNAVFVNEEDYDDCNTLNTSRIDETSFTVPHTTDAASTLRLRQKVKLSAWYRHLNVTGDIDLMGLDRFRFTNNPETVSQFLSFTTVIDGFL